MCVCVSRFLYSSVLLVSLQTEVFCKATSYTYRSNGITKATKTYIIQGIPFAGIVFSVTVNCDGHIDITEVANDAHHDRSHLDRMDNTFF